MKKLWNYVGRFSLVHVVTYSVIALVFLTFQESLSAYDRVALDFFQPYNWPGFMEILKQAFRGGVYALIIYPFYKNIVRDERGWLILFAALWGLGFLGYVEPVPGSIEGLIYTKTTLSEHFVVIIAGAVQVYFFIYLFLSWERWSEDRRKITN